MRAIYIATRSTCFPRISPIWLPSRLPSSFINRHRRYNQGFTIYFQKLYSSSVHPMSVDMILEAPTRNTEFKGKFGTLNIRTRSVGKTNVKQFPSFSSDRRTAQSRSAQQLLFLPRRCHRCSCPALAALPTCPALSNGGPGGVIFSENGVDWKSDKTRIEKFPPSFPLWQGRSEPWVFC